MSVVYDFAALKSAIKDRLGDQSADFDSKLELIIGGGEDRLILDLNFTIFDKLDDFSFSAGAPDATLPPGCLAARVIQLKSSGATLLPRSMEYVLDYQTTGGGAPIYWAQLNSTSIKVAPIPDTNYAAQAHYVANISPMSSTNTTTWLGNNMGNVLLHACLIEATKYIVADDRLPTWTGEYEKLKGSAIATFRHLIRRDYANISATPTAQGAR